MIGPARFLLRVEDARRLAEVMLEQLPDRLQHTAAVARTAQRLQAAVGPDDRRLLVAAAWLHDIGYAPRLRDTGFHALDGARFLSREGWPIRLCALVAHHSGARYVAPWRGLGSELSVYLYEESAVADALTHADQTVGPRGESMPIRQRMADMLRRHGPDSVQVRAHLFRGAVPARGGRADRAPTGRALMVAPAWRRDPSRPVEAIPPQAGLSVAQRQVPVFSVLIGEGNAAELTVVAKEITSGEFFVARNKDSLAKVFQEIRGYQ